MYDATIIPTILVHKVVQGFYHQQFWSRFEGLVFWRGLPEPQAPSTSTPSRIKNCPSPGSRRLKGRSPLKTTLKRHFMRVSDACYGFCLVLVSVIVIRSSWRNSTSLDMVAASSILTMARMSPRLNRVAIITFNRSQRSALSATVLDPNFPQQGSRIKGPGPVCWAPMTSEKGSSPSMQKCHDDVVSCAV